MTASPPIPPSRTATDSLQIPPSVRCLRRRYLYTPFIRIRGCVDVSPKLGVPFIFNSLSFLNPHILIPYFLILISFFILFFLKIKASTAVGLLRYAYGSAVIFLQSTHEGGLWDSECCIMKAQEEKGGCKLKITLTECEKKIFITLLSIKLVLLSIQCLDIVSELVFKFI